MSQRLNLYPKVIGIRLTVEDTRKLMMLCYGTKTTFSELIRHLIRSAEPLDVPKATFRRDEALSGD
jgi:hypothetical protein